MERKHNQEDENINLTVKPLATPSICCPLSFHMPFHPEANFHFGMAQASEQETNMALEALGRYERLQGISAILKTCGTFIREYVEVSWTQHTRHSGESQASGRDLQGTGASEAGV